MNHGNHFEKYYFDKNVIYAFFLVSERMADLTENETPLRILKVSE